ncbi:unnamed protein product [Timema podura]|uniref:ABC transmembrane type-1 domain-containing protein n=1 Tax=Timema podura TaxID=61482 RepID=A0ABN7NTA4_TIMPD|nr:unnamed protein product [Timema podura]
MSKTAMEEEKQLWQYEVGENESTLNASSIIPTSSFSIFTTELSLTIYGVLMIICVVFVLARSVLFFLFCMKSSIKLHNTMFENILRSKMRFFDTNPSGRILNRFSKDMGSVDELLPRALIDTIQQRYALFPVASCLISARSPVFSHLSASMNGLPTIRSSHAQQMVRKEFDHHQVRLATCLLRLASCNPTSFHFGLSSHASVCLETSSQEVLAAGVAVTIVIILRKKETEVSSWHCLSETTNAKHIRKDTEHQFRHWPGKSILPHSLSSCIHRATTWMIRKRSVQSLFAIETEGNTDERAHTDCHTSAWYLFICSSRAFGLWLDAFSNLFVAVVTFTFLLIPEGKTTSPENPF